MVCSAIGLLLGILLFQQLPSIPPLWVALPALVLAFSLFRRYPWLSAAALGFGWTWWQAAETFAGRLPDELAGRTVVVEGWVQGLPERQANGQRLFLDVEELVPQNAASSVPPWTGRVRLTWRSPPEQVRAGDRWRLTVRLYVPNGFRNPGGFDYEQWLYTSGVAATGYVLNDVGNRRQEGRSLRFAHHRAREAIRDRVELAGGASDGSALFNALIIGDRSGFDDRHWEVFRATGTSHLVAISGLHLGLVAGLVLWLVDRLWRRNGRLCLQVPAAYAGGFAALVAAAGYALLAGFSLPAERALAMISVGLGALSLRRMMSPSSTLAIALVAVVLLDPNAVLGGGFWLSFGAVVVIFFVISGRPPEGPVASWWRIQWSIALGLIPVLAAWGLPVAGIAPIVNLLAVPWFTLVIVPMSFATLVLMLIFPAWGAAMLQLDLWLLDQTFLALHVTAQAPGLRWEPAIPGVAAGLLAGAAVLVLLLPLPLRYRLLGLVMCLPLVLRGGNEIPAGGLRVTMLDVGQGLSTVVRTAHHTLVYDLGPRFSPAFNAAEAAVIPFLESEGVEQVDLLVLSHDDADHAGAWQRFLDRKAVGGLMAGQPDRLTVNARRCRRGDTWTWDSVRFEILHPAETGASGHDNDSSCVLRIIHQHASFLLTGDITRTVERRLDGDAVRADFVMVPHHGSRSSSSQELIRGSGARFALVSAGFRNHFGFPDPGVVDRWRAAGAQILNTAESGAVIIDVDAEGETEVTRFRDAARRYWHR